MPRDDERSDLIRRRQTSASYSRARGSTRGIGRPTRGAVRQRRPLPIEELIGQLTKLHGLTERMREQCIHIYWREIVGIRIADKTSPGALADGLLKVSAQSSVWMHELQFSKRGMIDQINQWMDAQRKWLGPSPPITDIRFALEMRRAPLVDPDHVRRLRERHRRRLRPRQDAIPPETSESERQAIRVDTSVIEDADLRAIIEAVRTKWNR